MIKQQQDLKNIIENQKTLINEITDLNNTIAMKKEFILRQNSQKMVQKSMSVN